MKRKNINIYMGHISFKRKDVIIFILIMTFVSVCSEGIIMNRYYKKKKEIHMGCKKMGMQYIDEFFQLNQDVIEQRLPDKMDASFLDKKDGLLEYRVFNLEGKIISPLEKKDDYLAGSDVFYLDAQSWALGRHRSHKHTYGSNTIDWEVKVIELARAILIPDRKSLVRRYWGMIAVRVNVSECRKIKSL